MTASRDQAPAGRVVEVGADQEAVLQRDQEVRRPLRVWVAVRDEQVAQQPAEPAPVLGDGLAHRVGGSGYSAAALTNGQPR